MYNVLRFFRILKEYDFVIINDTATVFILGAIKLVLPGFKCQVWMLDSWLSPPELCKGAMAKLLIKIKSFGLKGVDRILLHSRNNDAFCNAYGISQSKITYIPFKINGYDYVVKCPTSEGSYIFSGGYSRRDYDSLIQACRELPYSLKILTPAKYGNEVHRTFIDRNNLPANVEVINDDGSFESFANFVANSKFVVLPTYKLDFAATGIGVYLLSMALGKCVVITSGPSSDLILSDKQAVIVPPEDPVSLRSAIKKIYSDDVYRKSIAEEGQKYALSLGDEKKYYAYILNVIASEYNKQRESL